MKVFWTDRAKARLREIHDYIAQDAPLAAPKVVRRLVQCSRQLAELPWSGRSVPEYQQDDLRELLERPYRIIYVVLPDQGRVDVLTVRHYRQLLSSDLTEL
ncbi:type II toxin-antitoxin system RelE/ParE family toxin [Nevskia ramosa]|uniref:type II toxin-antitoxin system RelE/ParE family toxin n=1 Tax=Nevskia ramosa TaxID=64002 RepID=UPI003D121ED1